MMEGKEEQSQGFRPIVGIDLGTTNSASAYIAKGKPEIIPDQTGHVLIPSVVLMDPSGKTIVGEDARSALVAMPERTKAAVKREMGSSTPISLAEKTYSPEEISALILKKIKTSIDEKIGAGEKEAVITVPAYFTDEQRQATKRAGELAGFVVERIINEPTAAALAFGFQYLDKDRHLLVYDLGGGTFDVSVVEIMDGIIEVKASSGNSKLGGEDFDWRLVDWLAETMIQEHQVDPRQDVRALALLKEEAEKIKKQLSTENQVEIALPVVIMKNEQPLGLYTTMTQETFIGLIKPLLKETMTSITDVLQEADLPPDKVDAVLLVGGSTRIPRIHELITDLFGAAPMQDVNPDEAVALGAGVQAGLKSGALSDSGLIVTDIAPFSMGIAALSSNMQPGEYVPIIPKNTTIPVTRTERFYTSLPDQTVVQVEVYQGEEEWVKNNYFINEFLLEGLPAGPAGSEAVDVTFRYNLNGILEVTATSVSTEKSMTVTLEDAIDRSSDEAFQESLEKVKTATNDKYDDELDFEQQNLFDQLDEEAEEEPSFADLMKEAKQWKDRCQKARKDASADIEKRLQDVVESLDDAMNEENADAIEEAINMATDVLIDIDM